MTFCISITKHVNKGGIDVHGVPPDTELLFKPGRMRAKIKLHFLIEPPPSEKHTHTGSKVSKNQNSNLDSNHNWNSCFFVGEITYM